jgi:hypothetical protein
LVLRHEPVKQQSKRISRGSERGKTAVGRTIDHPRGREPGLDLKPVEDGEGEQAEDDAKEGEARVLLELANEGLHEVVHGAADGWQMRRKSRGRSRSKMSSRGTGREAATASRPPGLGFDRCPPRRRAAADNPVALRRLP